MPLYSVFEASRYLHVPENTLRSWLAGCEYPLRSGGSRRSEPVIELADPKTATFDSRAHRDDDGGHCRPLQDKTGESIADLAEDYGEDPLNIEEAVRCELQPAKAA